MKALNTILIIILGLILIGVVYFFDQDDEEVVPEGPNSTIVLSLDHNVFQIDEEDRIIYILEGTVQDDILDKLTAQDGSQQEYRITTSEGSKKAREELYEYDRLYVVAENGVTEDYYHFEFANELD